MASTLTGFQSSGFLLVGTPDTLMVAAPVDNNEALYHRIVVPVSLSTTTLASLNGCGCS
jgi:hypothetical protein